MSRRSSRAAPATPEAPEAPEPVTMRASTSSTASSAGHKYSSSIRRESAKSTARTSQYFSRENSQAPENDPEVTKTLKRKATDLDSPKTIAKKLADEETGISQSRRSSRRLTPARHEEPIIPKNRNNSQGVAPGRGEKSGTPQSRKSSRWATPARDEELGGSLSRRSSQGFAPGRAITEEAKTSKEKELWREGVKTGLGPGHEVWIEKPKARDPGGIQYEDQTIHPNTLLFLNDLSENNERVWLKAHDEDYRAAKKDWETFVETLTEKIIDKDSTIPPLPVKDLIFRIQRDIRFSKDPTPYKTHFSAAWSRTGKKGPYAAYYVHFQPGASFVGSGIWQPEAHKLTVLREEIDRGAHGLKVILRDRIMRREIFDGIPDEDEKVVKAFVNQNKETALKTKPRGYSHDHDNIELLRLRSFTIGKPISDEELLSSNVQQTITNLIGIMEPFVTYLNNLLMPDAVQESSSDISDSGEE